MQANEMPHVGSSFLAYVQDEVHLNCALVTTVIAADISLRKISWSGFQEELCKKE